MYYTLLIFKSLYLCRNGIAKIMQKSTAEIAKVAHDFVIPNIAEAAAVIAVASFIIDNPNLQVFRIVTDCENEHGDLDYREYYCEN